MIFYLTIEVDTELTHIPHIDAIDITLDGKEKHCTWDETDAQLINEDERLFVDYRFKGVSYDDEHGNDYYANGTIKEDSNVMIDKNFWWSESDWTEDDEDFVFEITNFVILDYDEENNKEIILEVIKGDHI